MAPWLWYDVIAELVRKRADLGFIFIGPDYFGGALMLPRSDNLLYLGAVDYQVLPAYARQFDVCFIPFAPGEIARTTSPLKLFEYFALEKPVVVTDDMLECTSFGEVLHGDSADSLSAAIDQALIIMDAPEFKASLAKLADDNDWDQRARDMEIIFTGVGYPQAPEIPG
jgi:glycosyltransferase involved in cell wall biosynthesis